ncbi:MAG TPA: superoxide dismutase family protein [Sphingomonas sp.]|jgi:Cu-Zn family superoxide dismutase|uniref:superoxide dismutase family protein n=1 Tax=Sphingomonas sp. TaxID=28214 RepID=UPI002ED81D24
MRDVWVKVTTLAMLGATACAMTACTMDVGGTGTAGGGAAMPRATATLMDATGAAKGNATFEQTASGLRMRVQATGMAPGPKGLHFHMMGKCDAPDFTTAGGHWNPTGMKHGKDSGAGPHLGDLPNIEIGADGRGQIDTVAAGVMLMSGATPLLDADGAAILIHAGPDDYRTDPSGNSGSRLACGVVTPA